jgi:hypothetical protein
VVAGSDLGLPPLTIAFERSDEDPLCFLSYWHYTFPRFGNPRYAELLKKMRL